MVHSVLFATVVVATGWILLRVLAHLRRGDRKRIAEDRAHELATARTTEALERPGALPENPIEVLSAAAVEVRAESETCPVCHGRQHVSEHVALRAAGLGLRRVELRCTGCGHRTQLFFRLRPQPN